MVGCPALVLVLDSPDSELLVVDVDEGPLSLDAVAAIGKAFLANALPTLLFTKRRLTTQKPDLTKAATALT